MVLIFCSFEIFHAFFGIDMYEPIHTYAISIKIYIIDFQGDRILYKQSKSLLIFSVGLFMHSSVKLITFD